MTKVQQRLAVDNEVDDKSPADAGGQTSKVSQDTIFCAVPDPREVRTIFLLLCCA